MIQRRMRDTHRRLDFAWSSEDGDGMPSEDEMPPEDGSDEMPPLRKVVMAGNAGGQNSLPAS